MVMGRYIQENEEDYVNRASVDSDMMEDKERSCCMGGGWVGAVIYVLVGLVVWTECMYRRREGEGGKEDDLQGQRR